MNEWDHVPKHENKNDGNPHDERFILQNLPIKHALFLSMFNVGNTVLWAHSAFWPKNQGKSGEEKESNREHTERVRKSKMNKQLLHGRVENTSTNSTTECHDTIGKR